MVAVLHQAVNAVQGSIRQRMNLEGGLGARPAAAQIVAGGRLKTKLAVQCRIAKRYHGGVAKLIERIQPVVDQLTTDALAAVLCVHRQRR